MKTKVEAAEFLGISVRTLLRYTAAGRIAAKQRRGSRGAETVYADEDLERFKTELEGVTYPVRAVVTPDTDARSALAITGGVGAIGDRLVSVLEMLAVERTGTKVQAPLADKLILTEREAAALLSYPLAQIKRDVAGGVLKHHKIGRSVRIKRADLDAYVKKL